MAEYIDRRPLFDALYDADAITVKGINIFRNFPTADVRPVVRGEWIYNDSEQLEDVFVATMRCSCCGECVDKEIHIFQYCIELEYKYCPNCGATMEES